MVTQSSLVHIDLVSYRLSLLLVEFLPRISEDLLPVSHYIIHPLVKPVELRQIGYMPADQAVKRGIMLIIGTDPDARGAVTSLLRPERNAFFSIHGPFQKASAVGNIVALRCSFFMLYGLRGTMLRTLLTHFTECLHPEIYGFVVNKRQISKNLT